MIKIKLKKKEINYLNAFVRKGKEKARTLTRARVLLLINKKKKVEIIAKACTTPPEGRQRWTVRLLAEEMGKQEGFKTINRESIRLTLKKATPSLG